MTPPPAVSDAEVEALIRYAESKAETAAAAEAGMWRSMAASMRSLHRDRQTAEARSAAGVEAERESIARDHEQNAAYWASQGKTGIPDADRIAESNRSIHALSAARIRHRQHASGPAALATLLAAAKKEAFLRGAEAERKACIAIVEEFDEDGGSVWPDGHDIGELIRERDLPTPPAGGADDAY